MDTERTNPDDPGDITEPVEAADPDLVTEETSPTPDVDEDALDDLPKGTPADGPSPLP